MNRQMSFLINLTILLVIILCLPAICGWVWNVTLNVLDGFQAQAYEMFNLTLPTY